MSTHKLSVHGVDKAFDARVVLQDINLHVDAHEVVCLIGASGSGKSTLLKAIDLQIPIDAGSISLDGDVITAPGVNADAIRARMGIVFQSFNLFPHKRVLDNITLGPIKVKGLDRTVAEATAMGLLGRFGLADKAREYPDRLSGGQQQRVAIIRALAMEPTLLLLDEVTSALDPVLVGEVLSLLRELKQQGMTMVIATHEMGFARDTADRVVFLHAGTVWESGVPSKLFRTPERPETQDFLERIVEAGRL